MLKLTRILAIVCAGLSALNFIGFFIYLFSQESLISFFGGISSEGVFIFPASIFIKVLGVLVSAVLLCVVAGRNIGFWAEIVIAAFLSCVIPPVEWFVSNVQVRLMGAYGSKAVAAYSALVSGYSILLTAVTFALSLMFIVCGLSVAAKVYERRLSREVSADESVLIG